MVKLLPITKTSISAETNRRASYRRMLQLKSIPRIVLP